ncbi:MAG TPA: F0F1 ATP synthase subunit beta, partial [Tenuifilaceae bacterium]|nr:F0F1 ATP synthase subunit beta [Tenuifilaceae bacterium]
MSKIVGEIIQVIGPVVDVSFPTEEEGLPNIHEALTVKRDDGTDLIVECQQHIGESTIRTVAMDSTDGLHRGMKVHATGKSITVPTGEQIKGRLLNVIGSPIDGMGSLSEDGEYQIHNKPPKYEDLSTETEV